MIDLNASRSLLVPHDLTFLSGSPYVYHCHHYNLFHDQTVDDILGDELGREVRIRAASSAIHDLLAGLTGANGSRTPAERIAMGQWLAGVMGHGRLKLAVDASGGTAEGSWLHYSHSWSEKYGARVRRRSPVDAVAAGFAAAIAEVAFDLPKGSMSVEQTQCVSMRAPNSAFVLRRAGTLHSVKPVVDLEAFKAVLDQEHEHGKHEDEIASIAETLQGFMRGVAGDERGLVEAFGVYVTMHLGNYYNETAFEAMRATEADSPRLLSLAESLFREAGHVCVFNTFSNILLSPEWEAINGMLVADPMRIIIGCLAIARGLGFGRWALQEYVPGERLIISTSSNYEAPFWVARYGYSERPRSFVFLGAALAMMVIATRMRLWEHPVLSQESYDALFRGEGLGFDAELVECQTTGARRTTAVVRAMR